MTDWIASIIANWPAWLVLTAVLIIAIIWIFGEAVFYGGLSPFEKKEWWQDKEKRLALKAKKKNDQLKMKERKG